MNIDVRFPPKLRFLFEPHRYKVLWGGRGAGGKSWSTARALLLIGKQPDLLWPGWIGEHGIRVLCYRETMHSIAESVHQLLSDQIRLMQLGDFYRIWQNHIIGKNGTEFFFAGVRQSVDNLKSYEGVDIAWGSQAEAMSKRSLNVVIPTLRKDIFIDAKKYSSELWFDFNPTFETDEIYKMFVEDRTAKFGAKWELPHDSVVQRLYSDDNPWFPEVLRREWENLKRRDPDEAEHVYGGQLRSTVEGAIYKKEIAAAEANGQFARVPYDPKLPAQTFWDIGPMHTRILISQSSMREFRIIDYIRGEDENLSQHIKALHERPYFYSKHHLPWDAKAKEYISGRTVEEQLKEAFGRERVVVAKQARREDGIAAARAIFPLCMFDKERCAEFIRGLRCYQYEWDDDLRTFKRTPLHDWASHDADAFRTLAVAIREEEKPAKQEQQFVGRSSFGRGGSGAWME